LICPWNSVRHSNSSWAPAGIPTTPWTQPASRPAT